MTWTKWNKFPGDELLFHPNNLSFLSSLFTSTEKIQKTFKGEKFLLKELTLINANPVGNITGLGLGLGFVFFL